jgi:phosphate transport system substrate-binding protein
MRLSFLLSIAALAFSLTGCGGADQPGSAPAPGADEALSGTITISGSSTVYRISRAAQVSYAKQRGRGVKVLLDGHGTSSGFSRYLQGEADIIDASRAAKLEEEEQAKAKGMDWTRFLVGYDGITVAVNPANTFVKALSVEQLRKLFAEDSTITKWSELDPSWPDRKIVLYTPDNDSGTYEYFSEAVLGSGKARQRKDVQASPDDNILVTGVAGDADALGYFSYAYYAANQDKLRAVPIAADSEAQPVAPTPETILNGTYRPLSRPLYIYVKNQALQRPEVADFVRFYIENIESLAAAAKYVPPTAEDQAENLKNLPAAK